MKQSDQTPISVDDLKEYLSGQDDFRLEIAVLKSFKTRKLIVLHGGTYEDPVTKKARQFDIRGSINKNGFTIHLAIECKNLKDSYPLLVSTLPRNEEESYHEVIYSHKKELNSFKIHGSNYDSVRLTGSSTIYKEKEPCGKSTTQVGRGKNGELTTGDGEVYGKWSQAVSSAFDLVSDSTSDYTRNEHGVALSIVIPVLVLNDGVLWEANYNEDGELNEDPKKVSSTEVYLGKDLWTGAFGVGYTFSHLHIFTLSGFEVFLEKLFSELEYWDALFPIEQIQERIREKDAEL